MCTKVLKGFVTAFGLEYLSRCILAVALIRTNLFLYTQVVGRYSYNTSYLFKVLAVKLLIF